MPINQLKQIVNFLPYFYLILKELEWIFFIEIENKKELSSNKIINALFI